jgi:prepilin-type N-terminal cleavage/methylation domain-containing protein
MNTRQDGQRTGRLARGGFTLVELLVVIAIIGILVAILVPAVGAVRKMAKNAATGAAITSIGTGLETFKADAKLGGAYPPSRSDRTDGFVMSPYTNLDIAITGTGLLVWALSGADLLGTPGFSVFGDPSARTLWSQCTGAAYNASNPTWSDAYALDANGQPAHARSGPYVDQSKLKVTRREGPPGNSAAFVIPEEYRYTGITREYPMYLDAYGYPILYYRADPAGRWPCDDLPDTRPGMRGVYHADDNRYLVETVASMPVPLRLSKSAEAHALNWGSSDNACTYTLVAGNQPPLGTFEGYIWDKNVQAKLWPQRADSYLLISPGQDGLYGTADDVTNFQPNGR